MVASIPAWGLILNTVEGKKKSQNSINILGGLSTSSPVLAFVGAAAFFSLAGIPPLAGFISKVFIFLMAIKSSMYLVAFIILSLSIVSTFYYINVVKTIYFEKNRNWVFYHTVSKGSSIVLAVSSTLLIFIFFDPSVISALSKSMASCLIYS
jgi:NADH-quinone oxidoreductase subunit N